MSVEKIHGFMPNVTQTNSNIPHNRVGRSKEGIDNTPVQSEKVTVVEQADEVNSKKRSEALVDEKEQSDEIFEKSVEQANKTLKVYNREIVREVHEKTHAVMYTIKDIKTHEVIAEFPPRKIQDMIAKMWELAGLFVDEKA